MNVRLDKYLSQLWLVSRRSVWKIVSSWTVLVNGEEVYKSDLKIQYGDTVTFWWIDIEVKEFVYLLLNKPSWYVCSDIDEWWHASYQHLLKDCPYGKMMHVAGRLDFDTEWLVLCSNDGQFTHQIISPKKHLEKEYYVRTRDEIHDKTISELEKWVMLEDGYVTMPAKAVKDGSHSLKLIIVEGKFHQVKRMLEAVWNEVIYLRRDRIGEWRIDGIELGKWKYINV
jgi:16S rRNA pseudouridine516 synthase